MRPVLVPAALALAIGLAGPLSAKTYLCTFTGNAIGKTIAEKVVIQHDESTGKVLVRDGFTNNYVGGPMPATLKSMNATRVLFSWQLPSLKDEKGQWIPGITFSLNINRSSLKASISSTPSGNYKSSRASGACAVQ